MRKKHLEKKATEKAKKVMMMDPEQTTLDL